MVDDICLRYISLEYYIKGSIQVMLFIMWRKESVICNMCNEPEESSEHMLLNCVKIISLWENVAGSIREISKIEFCDLQFVQ